MEVLHSCAENTAGIERMKGSKYVQSDSRAVYEHSDRVRQEGRRVLFVGTPCQVAALRLHLKQDAESVLLVDFVCHGVPSRRVWRSYVNWQERRAGSPLVHASFRSKVVGWRRFSMSLQFADGTAYSRPLDTDPYIRAFLSDICLRPSCYECAFKGLARQGDLTLADFWGVERINPQMDDDLGTSLVLVNTECGDSALAAVLPEMEVVEVDVGVALSHNAAAIRSASRHPASHLFYDDLDVLPFGRLVRKYCGGSLSRRLRITASGLMRRVRRSDATRPSGT